MKRLTAQRVKSLGRPGLHGDGGTLYLRVAPGGSKQWVQRIVIDGRRHDIGLGGWPLVSLAEARDIAFENRRKARRGENPLAERRRERAPTFREAARKTYDGLKTRWRSEKVRRTWWQQMELHALPRLGGLRVDRIGREDVLAVLTPIWAGKPEIARKVRARIKAVLAWAEAHGHCDANVAGEAIDGALPSMRGTGRNFRALPYREVAAALETVEASGASLAAKLCLRLTVLTAARSGEVRGMTWAEIDLEAATWTVPGGRMKAGREHRVPLSAAAADALARAEALRVEGSDLCFPSPRGGGQLSDMTLTKVLRDNGLAGRCTVHGFRSSFRDWCAETGRPREIAEAALAHVVGGVEGAYFRSDLFERRRRLMDAWAAYLTGGSADVVELRA
ncbi:MAG: tyrosine-type recombinase/integrase [Rhodobacter sp.]|nr:tyrosine-type recombinase/integrase [Rhodobacter sp.]